MNEFLVLVVEDDKPIRNLITTTLKMNDYRFITAVRGNEAIMLSASHKPDIIILDLGLPDIDGVEVIEPHLERCSYHHSQCKERGKGQDNSP